MRRREFINRKASVMGRTLDDLLPTYECQSGRNPIPGCLQVPTVGEVLRVLTLLEDILYPGYREPCRTDEPFETLVLEHLDDHGHEALVIAPGARPFQEEQETYRGFRIERVSTVMVPMVDSLPIGVPEARVASPTSTCTIAPKPPRATFERWKSNPTSAECSPA